MILNIEKYITAHPQVSVAELCLRFRTTAEVMSEMLALLQRKGRLVFSAGIKGCRDCSGCRKSCGAAAKS